MRNCCGGNHSGRCFSCGGNHFSNGIHHTRPLIVAALFILLLLLPQPAVAEQPIVLETFPPRGSVQTQPCGPFGVRLQPGSLTQYQDALVVRGSATGLRKRGDLHFSIAGDTLLFTPAIPFGPGEEVTITLKGDQGHTWQTIITPTDEHLTGNLAAMQPRTISLAAAFPSGDLEFLAWTWADLNADRDLEGVLLASSGGAHYLTTMARRYDWQNGLDDWLVRAPAICTTDNPVDLKTIDLDGDPNQDLVLLSLNGLQVWANPGAEFSPNGSQALEVDFPAGFISRTLVCGDVDSDGDDDLVVFGLFGLNYLVALNDGQGQFQIQTVQVVSALEPADKSLPWPIHALLKDADGDGLVDLIWTAEYQEQSSYRLRLARGLGDGSFETAGVVNETPEFSRGLLFGRLLDPWDNSNTPPSILNTTPDQGGGNICGFSFDGSWPVTPDGCVTGAGLNTQTGLIVAAHILDLYPELWYADSQTGILTARTLDANQSIQTLDLQTAISALQVGDFDFDGDGDLALLAADDAAIILLQTPGGSPQQAPVSDGVVCGGTMDFGVREALCATAAEPAFLPFTNDGLLPSRITQVDLDDPNNVFSVESWPVQWFGNGCLSPSASVLLPVNFAPDDTLSYTANLTVTVDWIGAAADGGDTTLVCEFQLMGSGGIHRLQDNGSGIGSLVWSSAQGYQTSGASLDFGTLPALAEVSVSTTVSLTNTGHFPVQVSPPGLLPEPFIILPAGARPLVPGQTQTWTVQVNPYADLVPAGVDSVDLLVDGDWIISPLTTFNCLPEQTLNQSLSVRLLSAAPCLAADPDCSGLAAICADADTVVVSEDDVFSYCLNQVGWSWPGALPELQVVENTLDWLNIQQLPETDGTWPTIALTSDLIGAEGGELLLELRDSQHPSVMRSFLLTVIVEPSRPDLTVVDMMFLPMQSGGEIQQQHPFLVDVVVEVTRQPVQGALMALEGGPCICYVDLFENVQINLMEGQRDTVRFVVESCGEAGDCPFTASIEPPEGLDGDFNPADNSLTMGALVAANRAPAIEISNLVLTPDDPGLEPCQSGITLNQISSSGMVQAFGVREENNLTFDVNSRDSDGDDTRLIVGLLPPFVTATATGDTMVSFDITPPEGIVTREVCEQFGPLVFQVIETGSAMPETTVVEIPLYVKWEGTDLQATLRNVPTSAGLAEIVRFNGQVHGLGYDAGPFTVDMWLENPDGVRVAGREVQYDGLGSGSAVTLPQVQFEVDQPGEYCAYIAITDGRDVNPDNNTDRVCFPVAAGPFVVSPNVATPNGDGHNDVIVFRFQNQTMQRPRIRIFELSGHLVYESETLDGTRSLTWDGRNQNGEAMPPGTYLYVVYNDDREFRTGTCGVVR